MNATRGRLPEMVVIIRGGWGILLITAPGRVLDSVPGTRQTPATRALARALGLRHLVQASVALTGLEIAQRAWWVDALHATSMLAVAAAAPASRRLAATDATVAAMFAVGGARACCRDCYANPT